MRNISQRNAQIAYLHFVRGCPTSAIAARVGLSASYVRRVIAERAADQLHEPDTRQQYQRVLRLERIATRRSALRESITNNQYIKGVNLRH